MLRVGEIDLMRGLGGCRFENANAAWGFQSQDAWWTAFSATFEKGERWPTLAFGSYVDRTKDQPWGTCTQNLLYRPARDNGEPARRFAAPLPLAPSYLPAVDAVHRLEPFGHAVAARLQRPRILRGRAGADVARRARRAAASLHRGRGLEIPAHLGHGHRQLRPHRLRLSRLFPDLDGRPASDARRTAPAGRAAEPDVQGDGVQTGRHGASPLCRRRPQAEHGLARAVRGRDKFRPGRFVRRQGQCVGDEGFRGARSQQSADAARGRDLRRDGRKGGDRQLRAGARRRARGFRVAAARSTFSSSTAMRRRGSGATTPPTLGHWVGLQAAQDGPNRNAIGRLDRGQSGRPRAAPRADGRRRPRERASDLGAFRVGRGG